MTKELNVIYSDKYLLYYIGSDSPISKDKTGKFLEKIEGSGIRYRIIEPQRATDDDILLVHSPEYLREAKRCAVNNSNLSLETPMNEDTLEATRYYVGGTILCLELALKGEPAVNLIGGMHHAGTRKSSGFCIFNDHAIAIRKLQSEGKIKKAAIYDLDVHAGQGTQEIFYSDPTVLTVSIHQDPKTIYPGTGFEWQRGDKEGVGANINVPLPPWTKEREYLVALDAVIERTKDFKSDVTVLLLGVDTYKDDHLGNFLLDVKSYKEIGRRFSNFNNLAVLFGGGYSDKIPELWISFLEGFLE